jgi:type IV pilus assembly protein PilC
MRRAPRYDVYSALFRQLAAGLRRGLPPHEVADILSQDTEAKPRDRRALSAFSAALAAGDSIPDAMQKIPQIFAAETTQWMRLAEQKGGLAVALEALAGDLARQDIGERTFRLALIWPLCVSAAMAVVFVIVGMYVMPAMKEVFGSFGIELPRLTRIIFAAGGLLFGGVWLPLVVLLAFGFTHRSLPTTVSDWLDNALDRVRFVGRFRRARFASRLIDLLRTYPEDSALLAASIAHLGTSTETTSLSSAASRLHAALAGGSALSSALAEEPALPRRLSLYTQLGEKMHNLSAVLSDLREAAEIELQESAARFERGAILMIYVALGIVIGTFLISVYMPIFRIGLLS